MVESSIQDDVDCALLGLLERGLLELDFSGCGVEHKLEIVGVVVDLGVVAGVGDCEDRGELFAIGYTPDTSNS